MVQYDITWAKKHMKTPWRPVVFHGNSMEYKLRPLKCNNCRTPLRTFGSSSWGHSK